MVYFLYVWYSCLADLIVRQRKFWVISIPAQKLLDFFFLSFIKRTLHIKRSTISVMIFGEVQLWYTAVIICDRNIKLMRSLYIYIYIHIYPSNISFLSIWMCANVYMYACILCVYSCIYVCIWVSICTRPNICAYCYAYYFMISLVGYKTPLWFTISYFWRTTLYYFLTMTMTMRTFTFVVPRMYPWQVRNDFNKDAYVIFSHLWLQ